MSDNHQRSRRPFNGEEDDTGSGRQPQRQLSQSKRRKQAAISLKSFSSKKGHDRAIQEFKKRKDTKFQKNAVLLREYQRAMKQEGYEVGKGASRKRGVYDDDDADGDNDNNNEEGESENRKDQRKKQKRHKSDPLAEARKKAELRKAEQEEQLSEQKDRKEMESQKQHGRKKRAKKMMKRTRRGQPLMKNVIGDLLGKLQSEAGDE